MADGRAGTAETEVLQAAADLVTAFGSHDTAAYFAAFAPTATFVFHTTPERLEDRAAYERLWRTWEQEDGFRVHGCESRNALVQLLGDVAVFTHDVTTDVEAGGTRETVQERETIVFARRATAGSPCTSTSRRGPTPGPPDPGALTRRPGAQPGRVIDRTSSAASSCSSVTSPRSTKPRSMTACRTVMPCATECLATFAAAS